MVVQKLYLHYVLFGFIALALPDWIRLLHYSRLKLFFAIKTAVVISVLKSDPVFYNKDTAARLKMYRDKSLQESTNTIATFNLKQN